MSSRCCCSCSKATDAAAGDEKKKVNPLVKLLDEFNNWGSKQCLPIEAAVRTITGAVPGAAMGLMVEALFEASCLAINIPSPSFGGSLDPEIMSLTGGYEPLLESCIAGTALEQVRIFAVTTGVSSGISCVMKKLRGKEDAKSCLVSGFGSGVMVSLVTGMRGPCVLSVGIAFALAHAGLFKLVEKCAQKEAEKVSHDKTKGMFSCMGLGLGLDHDVINFNNRLLNDNISLPLLTDRKDLKIGGRRARLRSNIGRY